MSTSKGLRARKLEHDRKILERELDDPPNDPFVLFHRGAIAIERRAWPQALDFLKRSMADSARTDSIANAVCPDQPRASDDGQLT